MSPRHLPALGDGDGVGRGACRERDARRRAMGICREFPTERPAAQVVRPRESRCGAASLSYRRYTETVTMSRVTSGCPAGQTESVSYVERSRSRTPVGGTGTDRDGQWERLRLTGVSGVTADAAVEVADGMEWVH